MLGTRTIDTATDGELDKQVIGIGVLIYLDFPGDPVRMWTGNYPLTWDGETWSGVSDLVSLSSVSESLDGTVQGMAVSLGGLELTAYQVESLGDYQGRDAQVWVVFTDPETGLVVGDPVLTFEGLMDSDETEDDGEGVGVTINLERRDADQLRPRPLRYTHADQQLVTDGGTDIGLTFVTAVQQNNLRWGTGG